MMDSKAMGLWINHRNIKSQWTKKGEIGKEDEDESKNMQSLTIKIIREWPKNIKN